MVERAVSYNQRGIQRQILEVGMRLRGALVVVGLLFFAAQPALTQSVSERPAPTGRATPPRTPDGHPDLQGVWNYSTATPLQRFEEFADFPFITDEEAERWVAKMLETRSADIRNPNPAADLARENNQFWFEQPTQMAKINGRVMTSLIRSAKWEIADSPGCCEGATSNP